MTLETVLSALAYFGMLLIGFALFWWTFDAPKLVERLCSFLVHESDIIEPFLPTPGEVLKHETAASLLAFAPQAQSSPDHDTSRSADARARYDAVFAPLNAATKEIWYFVPLLSGLAFHLLERARSTSPLLGSVTDEDPFVVPNEVPWKQLGESTIVPTTLPPAAKSKPSAPPPATKPMPEDKPSPSEEALFGDELIFQTLRVKAEQLVPAKWKFAIRFVLFNPLKETIVIDDMHTRLYEKDVPTPAFATIDYRGEVRLLQDNMLWKDEQSYSLKSGHGYEMTLVLEMTRLEGAPLDGRDSLREGPVRTVFGLLVDYYLVQGTKIKRRAVPSDCIYMFEFKYGNERTGLTAINAEKIEEFKSRHSHDPKMTKFLLTLEDHFKEHITFRPTPRA